MRNWGLVTSTLFGVILIWIVLRNFEGDNGHVFVHLFRRYCLILTWVLPQQSMSKPTRRVLPHDLV